MRGYGTTKRTILALSIYIHDEDLASLIMGQRCAEIDLISARSMVEDRLDLWLTGSKSIYLDILTPRLVVLAVYVRNCKDNIHLHGFMIIDGSYYSYI